MINLSIKAKRIGKEVKGLSVEIEYSKVEVKETIDMFGDLVIEVDKRRERAKAAYVACVNRALSQARARYEEEERETQENENKDL